LQTGQGHKLLVPVYNFTGVPPMMANQQWENTDYGPEQALVEPLRPFGMASIPVGGTATGR